MNLLQAYFSEFLFWAITPLVVVYYFVYSKKQSELSNFRQLANLSMLLFFSLLPQPSGPYYQSAVSLMRFFFPLMIVLILLVFMIAKENKALSKISYIALLSSVSVLPQLNYYPKLVIIWLLFSGTMLSITIKETK